MLCFYAARFPSVEINYTFQRDLSAKTLSRWIADTPPGFEFALKANRSITHIWRLGAEAAAPLREFLDSAGPLGDRLGPVLFQCHPTFKVDLARLNDFLALLPDGRRFAFEFRHESWWTDATKDALAANGAAWCTADTDDHDAPLDRSAPGFAYVRLRKTDYEDETLVRWAKDIGETLDDGTDVYCYLMHEDQCRGVRFAQRLQQMLARE